MAELEESFLDTLKSAIKTSSATAKARAAGDWFREKVKQASASTRMRAVTPNQLLKRQEEVVQHLEKCYSTSMILNLQSSISKSSFSVSI